VFKFITRRHFLINLLAAILLVFGLILLFLWSLGRLTSHGAYEKVPDVRNKLKPEGIKMLEAKGFAVQIQDSLYIDSLPPFAIIRQSPDAEMMVKSHRTIFLTVNRSQPPTVEMPNMVGFSFRNAEMYLKQLGFKLGDTTRKPDIAKDAILEQRYKGNIIKAGTKIFMGSTISLVLGNGLGDDEFNVPELVGSTYREVKETLKGYNLNLGALVIDPDVRDTASAFVYKQNPPRTTTREDVTNTNKIREGQAVDLWLSRIRKVVQADEPKEADKADKKEQQEDNK
jgi:eukaryotic-like serine/threonine-protein kinase